MRRVVIRRVSLCFLILVPLFVLLPQSSAATLSLALPSSDYPRGATVDPRPATNRQADRLLGPAHRKNFESLRRYDGEGWLQEALWYFKTGRGAVSERHQTIFGYGINVFRNRVGARDAINDVKIKTRSFRVDHLAARIFSSTDVKETLVFVFFQYRNVEVENYVEYVGVAPAATARSIRHLFNRESAHLARYARKLHQALQLNPPPPPTNTVTPTETPISLPSSVATAVASSTPTALPAATSTSTPSPTATSTSSPTGFVAQASMSQPSYRPRDNAVVNVDVTNDGSPVAGAQIVATYYYPKGNVSCTAVTDITGMASCSEQVPYLPDGTTIIVQVHVAGPNGESAQASASFTVHQSG